MIKNQILDPGNHQNMKCIILRKVVLEFGKYNLGLQSEKYICLHWTKSDTENTTFLNLWWKMWWCERKDRMRIQKGHFVGFYRLKLHQKKNGKHSHLVDYKFFLLQLALWASHANWIGTLPKWRANNTEISLQTFLHKCIPKDKDKYWPESFSCIAITIPIFLLLTHHKKESNIILIWQIYEP